MVETQANPDIHAPNAKPWRRWFHFSLRTLLLVVLLCGSGMALRWNWEPWGLERTLIGHSETVIDAAFAPDGQRIVTASRDTTARVWDAASGRQIAKLEGHTDLVSSAVYSPDGQRIATASHDNTARLWDVASGRQIAKLEGHT